MKMRAETQIATCEKGPVDVRELSRAMLKPTACHKKVGKVEQPAGSCLLEVEN